MNISTIGIISLLSACSSGEKSNDSASIFLVDSDGDGFVSGEDCDDGNPEIHPSAQEVCDGVDNDCDGAFDEDVEESFFGDSDGDGFGSPDLSISGCEAPSGFVDNSDDCDDTDNAVYPDGVEACDGVDNDCDGTVDEDDAVDAVVWYADNDGDGFGDADSITYSCTEPAGFVASSEDCNDAEVSISPAAVEYCNEIDDDCDGITDEDDAVDAVVWYADNDDDGFGDVDNITRACFQIEGFVANFDDCDDIDTHVSPSASEYCNDIDDDCDGTVDEDDAVDAVVWYADNDGDGFGDLNSTTHSCVEPVGYVSEATDCDDADDDTFPQALELCDGEDNNCDGSIDEGVGLVWYADVDSDGFGDAASSIQQCTQPTGFVGNDLDCNDGNVSIAPLADEYCNNIDDNCDGLVDENTAIDAQQWYLDHDFDGHGDALYAYISCEEPFGYAATSDDCNDTNSSVYPNASEVCDDLDHNCDGTIDYDTDGDGFSSATCGGSDCVDSDAGIFPDSTGACYYCGDGLITGTESCDDEGALDADGCSSTCQVESNSECVGEPSVCTVDATPDVFSFVDVTELPDVDVLSEPIVLSGFLGSLTATLTGNSSAFLLVNGVDVGASASVSEGDEVEISMRSGANPDDVVSATLEIGTQSTTWSITSRNDGQFFSFANTEGGRARHVLSTSDGGWLISGHVGTETTEKAYLLKLDQSFTKEWDLILEQRLTLYLEYARENSDGSFTAVGLDYNATNDASSIVVNVSESGVLLSEENITSSSEEWCNRPFELSDGGVLCIGGDRTSGLARRMMVRRLNSNLTPDWSYTMGHPSDWSWFGARTQLSNGDILLGGTFHDYFQNASGGYHTHLTRLSETGSVLSAQYDSSIVSHGVTDLIAHPDGGAMMLSFFGAVVTRLNSNLEEVWSWSLADANLSEQVFLEDGTIMLVGVSSSLGAGGRDIVLMNIDDDGNVIKAATLGSTEDETQFAVNDIGNQEVLISGITKIIDPSIDSGFVMRLGYNFEISPCTPFTVQTWTPQLSSFSYSFAAITPFHSAKTSSTVQTTTAELSHNVNLPNSCMTPWQ